MEEIIKSRKWYEKECNNAKKIRDSYALEYEALLKEYEKQMKKTFICGFDSHKKKSLKSSIIQYKQEYKMCQKMYLRLSCLMTGFLTYDEVYDSLSTERLKYYGEFRE